ncbi:hypothetical protein HYH03_011570 [Edaphochlamys debaryana]|uniref:Pherophorin domain-containing protein n=1 Tax=Edaphochlamys debaryana TaxID=47281 RepID=A0A835XVQ6_9CHLO|nr:hypothetical protein HYH03_011570 [Edaphochlamys debaryana]|eukprot:KAG2489938.1 hypothetical protein HYH03_011570 [Edaphochlamys debaryana]
MQGIASVTNDEDVTISIDLDTFLTASDCLTDLHVVVRAPMIVEQSSRVAYLSFGADTVVDPKLNPPLLQDFCPASISDDDSFAYARLELDCPQCVGNPPPSPPAPPAPPSPCLFQLANGSVTTRLDAQLLIDSSQNVAEQVTMSLEGDNLVVRVTLDPSYATFGEGFYSWDAYTTWADFGAQYVIFDDSLGTPVCQARSPTWGHGMQHQDVPLTYRYIPPGGFWEVPAPTQTLIFPLSTWRSKSEGQCTSMGILVLNITAVVSDPERTAEYWYDSFLSHNGAAVNSQVNTLAPRFDCESGWPFAYAQFDLACGCQPPNAPPPPPSHPPPRTAAPPAAASPAQHASAAASREPAPAAALRPPSAAARRRKPHFTPLSTNVFDTNQRTGAGRTNADGEWSWSSGAPNYGQAGIEYLSAPESGCECSPKPPPPPPNTPPPPPPENPPPPPPKNPPPPPPENPPPPPPENPPPPPPVNPPPPPPENPPPPPPENPPPPPPENPPPPPPPENPPPPPPENPPPPPLENPPPPPPENPPPPPPENPPPPPPENPPPPPPENPPPPPPENPPPPPPENPPPPPPVNPPPPPPENPPPPPPENPPPPPPENPPPPPPETPPPPPPENPPPPPPENPPPLPPENPPPPPPENPPPPPPENPPPPPPENPPPPPPENPPPPPPENPPPPPPGTPPPPPPNAPPPPPGEPPPGFPPPPPPGPQSVLFSIQTGTDKCTPISGPVGIEINGMDATCSAPRLDANGTVAGCQINTGDITNECLWNITVPRPGGLGWNGDVCIADGPARPDAPKANRAPPLPPDVPLETPIAPAKLKPPSPRRVKPSNRAPRIPPASPNGGNAFPFCACKRRNPSNTPYRLTHVSSNLMPPMADGSPRMQHCFSIDPVSCDPTTTCCGMGLKKLELFAVDGCAKAVKLALLDGNSVSWSFTSNVWQSRSYTTFKFPNLDLAREDVDQPLPLCIVLAGSGCTQLEDFCYDGKQKACRVAFFDQAGKELLPRVKDRPGPRHDKVIRLLD